MPQFNTTVDDTSPLITYLPATAWHAGSRTDDPHWGQYLNGTFTVTATTAATASFSFNGSSVWIFGARRPNHGLYSITLDGQRVSQFRGNESDGLRPLDAGGNEYQSVLFNATGLTEGSHEVVLTNEGANGGWLDLDFITWVSNIDTDFASSSTASSESSKFSTSGNGWTDAATKAELGVMSGIYTDVGGDSIEISFTGKYYLRPVILHRYQAYHHGVTGDAVKIYGSIGPYCGLVDVEIDGSASSSYNASRTETHTNQLLFFGSDLGSGKHTLKMTNNEINYGTLVIDHAEAHILNDISSSASASAQDDTNSGSNSSSGGSNKALIGGLCGALGFMLTLLLALSIWVYRRRRMVIPSKRATPSKMEALDIDQPPPAPSLVSIRPNSLSDYLQRSSGGEFFNRETHSDVSRSSRRTGSSSRSHPHSQTSLDAIAPFEHRRGHDEFSNKFATSSHLPYETPAGNIPNSKSRAVYANGNVSSNRMDSRLVGWHGKSRENLMHDSLNHGTGRALPVPPSPHNINRTVNLGSLPTRPAPTPQPHRSVSMVKGRRRSGARNSRIIRAGYNFFFAKPGSSNSSSAYAPSTVLTSEISERPTTTLSPVTEAPPPLPPSRSLTPQPPRPFQIVNQGDDALLS